ncbi:MAG: decaprenyl-phosphate phosphoribosyltransferase [Anaerolineae bacterium]|nr:decaprenyl-phosphate phosphoribosyltransferase [Anaerolineae bacterium]
MEQSGNSSFWQQPAVRFLYSNVYGLLRTLRPRQWIKNGLVFMALLFDHKLADGPLLLRTTAAFVLFCMVSSTVYIINDLADVEKDKLHPRKRRRALPSGQLKPWFAILGAAGILAICLPLSFWLNVYLGAIILGYFLLNLAYSFWLKHVVLIDVMVIAACYLLRVAAGVIAADAERFSPWLYLCTILLALFLAIGKRRNEMTLLAGTATTHRRILDEYTVPLLDEMNHLVTAGAVIAYSLYTFSAPNLPSDYSMMLTIPFVIYFLFRYQYLIHVKDEGGAPEMLLYQDRPLLLTVFLWGLAIVLIMYVLN